MGRKSRDIVDALERAQELIYEAWETAGSGRRIALAQKALTISPFCADAYVLLAEHAKPDSDEAVNFCRRGVEAGRTALGKSYDEYVGSFWGFLETRPYMRARHGLALALWNRGAHDEALAHFHDMLRLNPDDNQGIRYILAACLVEANRDAQLPALLAQYPEEDMAAWTWTIALAAFRRCGDDAESRRCLAEAMTSNAHVPKYLLGERQLPAQLPPLLSPGQEDEAIHYVAECRAGWNSTAGATEWLRAQTSARKKITTRSRARNVKKT
jgi:tetratricopeptide (TPR) repeat protein